MDDSNSLLSGGNGDNSDDSNVSGAGGKKATNRKNPDRKLPSTIKNPIAREEMVLVLTDIKKKEVLDELMFIKKVCDGTACFLVEVINDERVIKDDKIRIRGKELQENFRKQRDEIIAIAQELKALNPELMESLSAQSLEALDSKKLKELLDKLKTHKEQIAKQRAIIAEVNKFYAKNTSLKGPTNFLLSRIPELNNSTKLTTAEASIILKTLDTPNVIRLFSKIVFYTKGEKNNYSEVMAEACEKLSEKVKENKLKLEAADEKRKEDIGKYIAYLFTKFPEAKVHEVLLKLCSESPFNSMERMRVAIENLHIEEYRKKFREDPKPVYFVA